MTALLGLPLDNAAEACRAQGFEPQVTYTCAPPARGAAPRSDGTPRVVAVRGQTLVVALFHDALSSTQGEAH